MKTFALIAALFAGATMAAPVEAEHQALCWKACFPEAPKCPENMIATRMGGCWTCCLK
ncbi:hypothetical protein OCS_01881 [Ophiocordyceps sinensis CO18]|uniref:Uncharacterized protein n=1 Tax=Ophiocordyceps sinensis (strain Co18 / CGMCC 3.14243) TaxID=911162 RepID=T5AIH8_OPHSC|nr:hypothetical protein OCS_01881 [Ophiocordyceps sinensis CO18]